MTAPKKIKPKGIPPPKPRKKKGGRLPGAQAAPSGVMREMRSKLFMLYCAAPPPKPPPLSEMLLRPEFQGLSYRTAEDWRAQDDWAGGREKFQAGLYAQMQTRFGDKLAQATMLMLDEMVPIKNKILEALKLMEFSDVSADKLLNSWVKVMELQAKLTAQAVGLVTPTPQGSQNAEQTAGDGTSGIAWGGTSITVEEAREIGLGIMRKRREEAVKALAATAAPPVGGHGPNGAAHGAGGVPGK